MGTGAGAGQGRGLARPAADGRAKLLRWWLNLVAKHKSDELFMLNLLLITLGLSLDHRARRVVAGAGGLCGRHADFGNRIQAPGETDIRPFHDVLLGLFSSPSA